MQCDPSADSPHQFRLYTVTWRPVRCATDVRACLSYHLELRFTQVCDTHRCQIPGPLARYDNRSNLVYTNQQLALHSTQFDKHHCMTWQVLNGRHFWTSPNHYGMNTYGNNKSDEVVCEYLSNGPVRHAHSVKITSNKIVFWCVQNNWQCQRKNDMRHTILT